MGVRGLEERRGMGGKEVEVDDGLERRVRGGVGRGGVREEPGILSAVGTTASRG